MTSRKAAASLIIAATAGVLGGCPAVGEGNSVQTGTVVHFAEVHMESADSGHEHAAAGTDSVSQAAASVPGLSSSRGGYAHEQLDHHHGHDKNGLGVSLYRIYLVFDTPELVPCTSLARLPPSLLDAIIGTAEAHTGHGNEPTAGRGLDKPNVIDVMAADDFVLPLGSRAIAPGRYCGLRVGLARLASDAYGKPAFAAASADDPTTVPEVPDLSGKAFSIKADYCAEKDAAGVCQRRAKADVDDAGLMLPNVISLDFEQPIVLDATNRSAHVAVGIEYGNWIHDLDVTQLAVSAAERQKLLSNIAASFHIHAAGAGSLPPND